MKKNVIKQKLKDSKLFHNDSTIRSLLNGSRYPSYSKAVVLEQKFDIPIEVWKDIKSFITESLSEEENQNKYREEGKSI